MIIDNFWETFEGTFVSGGTIGYNDWMDAWLNANLNVSDGQTSTSVVNSEPAAAIYALDPDNMKYKAIVWVDRPLPQPDRWELQIIYDDLDR